MLIGINAAAAIKRPRTGVEEYTYQLIKHLTMLPEAKEHRFFLYVPSFVKGGLGRSCSDESSRSGSETLQGRMTDSKRRILKISSSPSFLKKGENSSFDFPMPSNFEVRILRWPFPFFWTQIRLVWEARRRAPDVLFIPVHVLPFGAPPNSVVAIHGLEYEYWPRCYPLVSRLYLHWSTARALAHARRLIAVSENTKNDLIKLYGGKAEKIVVVHHGISIKKDEICPCFVFSSRRDREKEEVGIVNPYILYIGRIETKKNIQGILEAYKILKEKYNMPHKLVLVGAPGFGYQKLKAQSLKLKIKEEIILTGYVSEEEKRHLLAGADLFLFPSFYEGFGLPVLEAQAAGVPVVTSFNSCLPEVAGQGALFVNPTSPAQIAEAVKQTIDDKFLRDRLIQLGYENIKRFSWEKCARETLKVLIGK